jgi:hypothetical protein
VAGFTQALSSWRVLTAYLGPEPEHDQRYQDERDHSIINAAQQVCQAFGLWARDTDDNRVQSLVSIMKRASELGITLFSQPSAFEWQWHGNSHDSTKIVVLPGLYKTTDKDAQPIEPPMCLVEPRLGALSGH